MIRGLHVSAVVCLTAGAYLYVPGVSETAAAAEPRRGVIEEVIVTARKREESAQDVPVAITAISEELTRGSIRSLADLNGFAPNVQIDTDGSRGGGAADITIRGISPTRTDDNSFDSPIGVMIDGIYLGSLAGQVLENFDIERVEVLRGPQGTLFGKNTVGGVVHVLRTRPTGELGGKFRLTAGEDGQQELRAVVNTPIIEDVLAGKFFFTSIQDDGFLKNVTIGGKSGEKDYQNYGATFMLTPNDSFEARLTIEKFKDDSLLNAFHTNYNTAPGVIPPPANPLIETDYSGGFLNCALNPSVCRTSLKTPNRSENDTENTAELDTDAITLNMSFDLNENMQLVSVTGYRDTSEYRIYDFDGSAAPFITIERWNDYDQFSQEFRIDGSWDNISMTAGVYYWNSEFEQDWVTGGRFWATLFGAVAYDPAAWGACAAGALAPVFCDAGLAQVEAGGDVTQILYETQETTSVAAFAQVDWTFAPKWTATFGLRWTEERKDFVAGQAYLSNVARQRARNFPEYADLNQTWREVSPKLGLTYQWTDDAIVYATYSEGFHSGGFFGVNQNTRDFIRDQYDPEFAESWELGLKSTWLENRMLLNLALFRNDFKDKQEQSVQADPETRTVATIFDNAADARYQGFEVEARFYFNEYVNMFLTYGYLDAEYKEFETDIRPNDLNDQVEDASFLKPRNAPENTFGIGGTLSVPVGAGAVELWTKYAWVDETEGDLLNATNARVKSREDLAATLGYYTEQWSLVAFGRNLTDDRNEGFTPISNLFAVGSVNRPRHIGVEFTYEF